MEAVGDILSALIQAFCLLIEFLAEVAVWFLQLLFFVVENIVCGVLWLCRCSKFAGPRRIKRLSEETRFVIRSCLHTILALGLVGGIVYVAWFRKPATVPEPARAPEPTKMEKTLRVIEKAKQLKETLLPPKPQP